MSPLSWLGYVLKLCSGVDSVRQNRHTRPGPGQAEPGHLHQILMYFP